MKRLAYALVISAVAGGGSAVAADVKKVPDQSFGDWVLHCQEIKPGDTACRLHQRIVSADTKLPVAVFAIARNPGSKELRLTGVLPLGLDIPAGVTAKAGDVTLPFTVQTCVKRGCVASLTVDDKTLEKLRGTTSFTATFKMRTVAEPTSIPVSLKGVAEGLKALDGK